MPELSRVVHLEAHGFAPEAQRGIRDARRRGVEVSRVFALQPPKALYFPHVTFGSVPWVKSALFYWEGILRMTPWGITPQDTPEIRELVDAGLIENLPSEPFRMKARTIFAKRLEELLRERGGTLPDSIPAPHGIRGIGPERATARLKEIAEWLEDQGYLLSARAMVEQRAQTIGLLATAMAYVVSRERHLAPVTDDPLFDAVGTYFEQAKLTEDSTAVPVDGQVVAQLLVPTPSAEAVADLSVSRLVEIRHKYAKQRRAFREKVQAHASAIANLPTVEAIRDHLKDFATDIQEDIESERSAMHEAKLKERWALLGVSAPAAIAVGLTLAGTTLPISGPVGGFCSLALGVSQWFLQRRPGPQTPGHYLLTLESAVSAGQGRGLSKSLRRLVSAR